MKRFFLQLLSFGLFLSISFGIIYLLNRFYYARDSYNNEFSVKGELIQKIPSPKIIFLGGSNVAFGLDSKLISDSMSLPVVNAGLVAGIGMKYTLDAYESYFKKNDILVFLPEYEHFFGKTAYGNPETAGFLPYLYDFDPLLLNKEQWEVVVRGFPQSTLQSFVKGFFYDVKSKLRKQPQTSFEYKMSGFNQYGDEVSHWVYPSSGNSIHPVKISGTFNESYVNHLIGQLKRLQDKGVSIMMMPAITSKRHLETNRDSIKKIYQVMSRRGFPYVIDPDTLSYPDSLMYNTFYHLQHKGVVINSRRIVNILRHNTASFVK